MNGERHAHIIRSISYLGGDMKPAASLFTALIIFLMAQPILINCQAAAKPCLPVKSACGDNTCGKAKTAEPEKKTDENGRRDNGACNPFASCSQCHFTAARMFDMELPGFALNIQRIIKNDHLRSSYTSDFWQPPEWS
jgi:hypothetical protein